jgi:hypothetical protein
MILKTIYFVNKKEEVVKDVKDATAVMTTEFNTPNPQLLLIPIISFSHAPKLGDVFALTGNGTILSIYKKAG